MAEEKIRIADIAKIAGVSATTVSNVIHGRTEKVSKKTKRRVEEILNAYGYAPSMGALILSGKSSRMIAVVIKRREEWQEADAKLGEILEEIEKRLYEKRYYVLLHFVKTAEEFLSYAASWKLDGIICIRFEEEEDRKFWCACRIPVVMMKSTGKIYRKAGEAAARFLLKTEVRKIWFLDGTVSCGKEIWRGLQKTCVRGGMDVKEERYQEIPKDRELRKMFYKIRLAGMAFSADVLVFASDAQGAEAVGYLSDLEIQVPKEIKVLGIGNSGDALLCRPQLACVEVDEKEMVKEALEELFLKIMQGYVLTKNGKNRIKIRIRESYN